MARAAIGETTVEYVEAGRGSPLVLVHGSASDYRTWRAPQRVLADRFRVIAYSRRYHWPNETIPDGADYAMAEHVADLGAVLDALRATPAHLVGHSYGAFVSLLLALQEPRRVRSLVLAEPPVVTLFVSDPPRPLEMLTLLARRPRTAAALLALGVTGLGPAAAAARRGDLEAATRLSGRAILGRSAYARLSDARRAQARDNAIPAELLGSGFPTLDAERVRALRTPTLLLTAQSSPGVFHRLVDRLEELLPHTERAEIADASHLMHEDNPAAFCAAVEAFAERHAP